MNIYKPKFKDRKTGERRETSRWFLDFRDHNGTRQRFKGDNDKHRTAEFGRMLENLVRFRKRKGIQPTDRLWNWLQGLPADVQGRLVDLDLAARWWFPAFNKGERLDSIIADYEIWLRTTKSKNGFHRSKKHISNTMSKIRAIVNGCGFKTWDDIRKSAVETFLGGLSISAGYYNLFVQAIKQFCQWCVREGKAEFSPVQFLDRLSMPDKEKRQALNYDAVCRLLRTTVNAGERYGMPGLERAILYCVAVQSGYRANELRHLTVGDFDAKKATLTLKAEHCKDRRDASQFITLALAGHLNNYLDGKDSKSPLFSMWSQRTAEMIKADAADAGLPLIDDKGRELVFHSTRHTLRTSLVKARVTESIIDRIMRHKPAGIGRRFYTHITDFEIREAIERLPEYPWPGELVQSRATKAVS